MISFSETHKYQSIYTYIYVQQEVYDYNVYSSWAGLKAARDESKIVN